MALKIVRLAAADYRNGRRRCPQALPDAPNDLASTLITRGSRWISYIPAVTAQARDGSGLDDGFPVFVVRWKWLSMWI